MLIVGDLNTSGQIIQTPPQKKQTRVNLYSRGNGFNIYRTLNPMAAEYTFFHQFTKFSLE
jgi:hypothetical protein